jgi:zinc transport system ATP-binding protein
MPEKLIKLKQVDYSIEQKIILDNITLDINSGDYIGLIGPNGAGKTTLIKLILDLILPTSGKITKKDNIKIGYVAQRSVSREEFFPASVKEVVLSGLIGKKVDLQIYEKAMDDCGIKEIERDLFNNLSGGLRQRTIIARSLINSPELLILDEPTTGVDSKHQFKLYSLLKKLNSQGITIIIVSHDIEAITKEVKQIVCLDKKLLYDCPSHQMNEDKIHKIYGNNFLHINHNHGI